MKPTLGDKVDLFGVDYTVTDYEHSTSVIIDAARERQSFAVSALAVHGLMEAASDDVFRAKVKTIDLVTPDGQPVKWAMNAIHSTALEDRVYGPDLTWHVIRGAAENSIPVFLFGSTEETCIAFKTNIQREHPDLEVFYQADRFRDATPEEDEADVATINQSNAGVVLVGRGCPRQERWVAEHRGRVNAAMLAVGAAFDYGAETLTPPPEWMQRSGLQWLFRLGQDPKRLWKRYLVTNSQFIGRFAVAYARSRLASR